MATANLWPNVAITCDFETKTDSRGVQSGRYWLGTSYIEALHTAGANAYIVPFVQNLSAEQAMNMLRPMAALVVSGGAFDIDPGLYNQRQHPLCGPQNGPRTAFELQLLKAAGAMNMPVLGICGGMQLMVVLHGGSLHQDVSLRPNTHAHEQPFDKARPFHQVAVVRGSRLEACSSQAILQVNSTHHQLVDDAGFLTVTGRSPDGVIEAVEMAQQTFYVGVQWHPESLKDGSGLGLYRGLVEAARQRLGPSGV